MNKYLDAFVAAVLYVAVIDPVIQELFSEHRGGGWAGFKRRVHAAFPVASSKGENDV